MKILDRWYITFGGVNIITVLGRNVSEAKAADAARAQYTLLEPLGAESVTLKLSARLYDK